MSKYKFNKTGFICDNDRAAINHARANYNSMIDAYVDLECVEIKYCKFCNEMCALKSIIIGFKSYCGKKECLSKLTSDNMKNRKRSDESYIKYIKRNQDKYFNFNNYPMYDEYLNKQIYDIWKFVKKDDFGIDRICMLSGERFRFCIFDDCDNISNYYISPSKSMMKYRKLEVIEIHLISEMMQTNMNRDDIFEIYNKSSDLMKMAIKRFLNFDNSTVILTKIYNNEEFTFKKINTSKWYLITNKYDKNKVCPICNIEFNNSQLVYNNELDAFKIKYNKPLRFCSKKCYKEAKANSSKYFPVSDKTRLKQSNTMKRRIALGEFTPNVTNSWCKSRVYNLDKSIAFRSTWEACFYAIMKGENLVYEHTRVQYKLDGKIKNYIIDFYDANNNILYEIKPNSKKDDEVNKLKFDAATQYCITNSIKFVIIDDDWFFNNFNGYDEILKYIDIDKDLLIKRMKGVFRK